MFILTAAWSINFCSAYIGVEVLIAIAIASLGLESISIVEPDCSTIILAKKVSSERFDITIFCTVPFKLVITPQRRSWVKGLGTDTSCSFNAIESASEGPIHIGKYKSESFTFNITTVI